MEGFAAVVGAVNLDISGTAGQAYIPMDSNPGAVRTSPGGVGRNIAENLVRLGCRVQLFTVLGGDDRAEMLRGSCALLGIGLDYALTFPEASTSTYLCVNDERGEMQAAVSDMGIYDRLTAEHARQWLPVLNRAGVVIADGNLPREVLTFLADHLETPLFCDPVSVNKADKTAEAMKGMALFKPNRMEAAYLAGMARESAPEALADTLMKTGLKAVLISLGAEGVWYQNASERGSLPTLVRDPVNTTGCGDAFLAGAAWAFLQGGTLKEMARAGLAAAAVCAESSRAVNPAMSREALERYL